MVKRDKLGRFQVDKDYYHGVRNVLHAQRKSLFSQVRKLPCITGFGLGLQRTDGNLTGDIALLIGVIKKEPLSSLPISELVPSAIQLDDPVSGKRRIKIKTDVIETGFIRPHGIRCDRVRPARPGCSVSHFDVTTGTLGCWVVERETYKILFLSNNHVLADANRGQVGHDIYQPGTYCAGVPSANRYAKLHNFVPLSGYTNLVDAAVAEPFSEDPDLNIIGIGEPTGTIDLDESDVGLLLSGYGNTSGVHTGSARNYVLSVDFTTNPIFYGNDKKADGPYYGFVNQILLHNETNQPYIPGDSGTVYVLEQDDDVLIAGLNFAGSSTIAIGNHIRHVLNSLNVDICLAGAATDERTAMTFRSFRSQYMTGMGLEKAMRQALVRLAPSIARILRESESFRKHWSRLSTDIERAIKTGDIHPDKPVPKVLLEQSLSLLQEATHQIDRSKVQTLRDAAILLRETEEKPLKSILVKSLKLPKNKKRKK